MSQIPALESDLKAARAYIKELEAKNKRLKELFLEWSPLHPTESKALLERRE